MGRLLDGIIRWSIDNRGVVLLCALAAAVAGVWTAGGASLDAMPDFSPPRVVLQTEAPGMATLDVEQLVTRPLERALLGTPQVTSVRSFSMSGLSVVTLLFEEGLDVYRARQLVSERIQLARGRLPRAAQEPQLAPVVAPVGALLKLCLTRGEGQATLRELRTFADWTLTPRLLSIAGVSQVVVHGGDVERIEVRPDLARMRERGVKLDELAAAVEASQAIEGAGFVDRGNARLDVVNETRLALEDAPEQLAASSLQSRTTRIGDVAEVVRGDEPRVGAALYDGGPAVFVQVMKLPWVDTRRVTALVERALDELKRELPPGARIQPPVYRQADFIKTSVWSVGRAMLIGSLLVVVILIAFLRRGQLAVISLTAIPLSLLAALAVLVRSGASINGMTLGGLAIAVGEVVDDAIVDVENVWRRLRENAALEKPRPVLDVIHDASVEVRGVVVYASIIVAIVLVPVLLLGGVAGRIFSPLAQAYVLAIAASLLVALTVTPAMCSWLLPRLATGEAHLPRLSLRLLELYRVLLRGAVRRPRLVFGVAGAAALAALAALPLLGGRFLPEFNENAAIVHVNALPGTSLVETARLGARIDGQLRPVASVHTAAHAGRAELGEDTLPVNQMEMDVLLKPDAGNWDKAARDLARRIAKVPGITFAIEGFLTERIHEILSGQTAPVVVTITGPDLQRLRELATEATRIMESTPGLGTVRPEPQIDVPQLAIHPHRAALARFGVTEKQLVDSVVAWRQGRPVSQVLGRDGRVVDVVIAGTGLGLGDIPVQRTAGSSIPLTALADVDVVPAPAIVFHDGGVRRISVGADARGGGLSRAVARLEQRLAKELRLPGSYHLEVAGEAAARSEAGLRLALVGALVLGVVFVILVIAFRSARDAGIILLNFPLGLVGGVGAGLLNSEGLSVAGLVGFVTLFGIIARNGIMLVAHKRHLDATAPDSDPIERILQASEERLLPILMTAASAGLGLLPLALSIFGRGSELESPMAMIVCGGLLTATSLNMLVLPAVYVWLERRR